MPRGGIVGLVSQSEPARMRGVRFKPADNWPLPVDACHHNEICRAHDCQNNKKRVAVRGAGVSIQVAILKVLASHDSGRATTASLKRDIAILATSGPEWNARMRRLSGRVPTIDILASGHVLWDGDGWQITAEGRGFLRALEAVTQDNRLAETGPCGPTGGETAERPRAELIVVGHRFKRR
jgi:hypothetical protein